MARSGRKGTELYLNFEECQTDNRDRRRNNRGYRNEGRTASFGGGRDNHRENRRDNRHDGRGGNRRDNRRNPNDTVRPPTAPNLESKTDFPGLGLKN